MLFMRSPSPSVSMIAESVMPSPSKRPQSPRPGFPQQRPPQQMAAMAQRPTPNAPKKSKNNTPLIAGAVGGGLVLLLIIVLIVAL
ncbi:hypothetical protein M3A74_00590 [Corynebacterium appendicis]|nr:hypothetical protein [Corynebacterium appendicis]MCT1683318.1 hypothetical protein [Corynebacterium appendicis]